MPEESGTAADEVKTDTVLSRKMKKILDSKLENDNDTMDALKELSTFFTENNLKNRRNLRGEIERRNLQINHDFLAAFETVKLTLDSLHSNVVGMSKSCTNMQARLAASKTVTEELMRKTTDVQSVSRRLQVQQEIAERFRERLSLSQAEVETLQARPGQHKISDEFFSVLEKVGRIRGDCRVLLAAGHQTAALSTLDRMTELQEAGLDRLYRWALSTVRNTELAEPALAQLSRALSHLQERDVLLQQVVEEFISARRAALVRNFIEALTVGGPGGSPRPIELQAHEPARYIGDMLAWLHQAWPGERETVAQLVRQCGGQDRAELEGRMMVGVTEGVCRPLQSRVEQILVSEPSPVTLYQLTNIIRFYQSTLSSVITSTTTTSGLTTTLAELSQLALTQFMSRLGSSVSGTLGRGEVLGGDLAPAPATSSLLQLVREVLASHSVVEDSKEDVPAILSCVCDPLTAQLEATAAKLPSQDGAVFLINNLHQVRTMLSLYQTPDSRLDQLASKIDSSLATLSSHQTSHLLSALGLTSLLPLLPGGDGTPLSTVPGCQQEDMEQFSARLDNFLAAPDLVLLPATRLLLSSQHRRLVTSRACSELANTYSSLHTAVINPGNPQSQSTLLSSPNLLQVTDTSPASSARLQNKSTNSFSSNCDLLPHFL